MVVLLVILGILVIYMFSCFIAIPIVKKRKFFARHMIIGFETDENIEVVKKIAQDIYHNKQLPENDIYKINIEEGEVKVENKKVEVIYNGNEHFVTNKAFSEESAVFCVGLEIFCLLAPFIIFLSLFIFLIIGYKI